MAGFDDIAPAGKGPRSGPATLSPKAAIPDPAIVALALAAVAGALIGIPLIAVLASMIVVVVLLARLWARFALDGVTYACLPLSPNVMEGEDFSLAMTIENNKPLPVPWLQISQFIPRGLEIVESDAAIRSPFGGKTIEVVTNLGRYERVTVLHRLRATRRGHYDLSSASLAGGDLFGFYDTRRDRDPARVGVVAFPRIVPLPEFILPSARPIGDAASRRLVTEDQNRPVTVREYMPGDPMKWIDWKTTARQRRLYVKRFEPSISQHVVILLECRTGSEAAAGWSERPWLLDAVASAAASVAYRSAELGYGVGLIANGIPPSHYTRSMIEPGHGPQQLTVILQALACVQSTMTQPLETVAGQPGSKGLPYGATIVFIAGVYHQATVQFVRDLARYGHRLVTIDIGGDPPPVIANLGVRDYRHTFGAPPRADESSATHA
jgi:uncharacterized protein (DUF58 family)